MRNKVNVGGRPRYFWAEKICDGLYYECNRAGETVPGSTLHGIVASPKGILWEKPAKMNLKYADLEVCDKGENLP